MSGGVSIGPGGLTAGLSVGGAGPVAQTPFQASLLPASFRGVPFQVFDNTGELGRRGATHEYPFRDTPYTEDLGRRARRVMFRGFVLGDDCALQRDALIAALELKGPGLLVHPSAGTMMMQPDPTRPCRYTERWDHGRLVELELSFVEPGMPIYPSSTGDTTAASSAAADQIDKAGSQDLQAATGGVTTESSATFAAAGAALAGSSVSMLGPPTTVGGPDLGLP